ncbi:hypothetical protein SH1V18_02400 [Vallitalea longa]|uniref:Peptidase S8/S53 domain-containing protein n=1 Tax=Vallitalea longa TaxID=2936439 RepID=A0A9W5Y755_9FIRM|nr:S8/S53 family peptidase [Vallitalea longa]GKX27760.1 hypothetical protein SH1V18_02400 [Vallitalea longa]
MKKYISILLVLCMSFCFGCTPVQESSEHGQDEKVIICPNLPEPLIYDRENIDSIEEVRDEISGRYEFRGYDLSKLAVSYNNILFSVFDTNTKWPEDFQTNVDIDKIIEYGKNPGLDIKKLHEKGLTGKDINVAVIDTRLLLDHCEYEDRLVYYEEMYKMSGPAHYHGTPITSILAGKNVGILPEANIYYFAYTDGIIDYEEAYLHLSNAIRKIIEINTNLPDEQKIKVVSISSGWDNETENGKKVTEAIELAKKEGLFVISAKLLDTHNYYYDGALREPLSNPDSFDSYKLKDYIFPFYQDKKGILLIPMDARYVASATGNEDYVMYTRGAWSMVVPYISGLYALACQVNENITPDEFWTQAILTGDLMDGGKANNQVLVNPTKLFEAIKKLN